MLKIRLQRIGKIKKAYFRVVLVEHTTKPKGAFLELLGSYDPHQKVFNVKKDRIEYWISKGAQMSPTVNNLLVNYKVSDHPKVQSWKPKASTQAKAKEAKENEAKASEAKAVAQQSSPEAPMSPEPSTGEAPVAEASNDLTSQESQPSLAS